MLDSETQAVLEKAAKKAAEPKIIIIRESLLESLLVDSTTYVLIVAVIGTGWFLGSSAMEWAGFVILAITAMTVAVGKEGKKKTIKEAREFLDKLETKK